MQKKHVHIIKWLLPFSWLYGFVVCLRNKFFKWGLLKRKSYNIPVICVGNIAVGGTGKTPHIEYLIRLLKDEFRVAVLSRGYKRKSKGFILAKPESTSREIGDEPYQIWNKFPDITVAVDENRCRGIERLLSQPENQKPQVILLDDAFQHRYVKPSLSIILTDYNRPYYEDTVLPAGRLRESADNADQANIIIVSKCPKELKPIDRRILQHRINPYPYQNLLFTTFTYGSLTPVFNSEEKSLRLADLKTKSVLLVCGIASPKPLVKLLKRNSKELESIIYGDHHNFTQKDIIYINNKYEELNDLHKIVVLTEKDAARIKNMSGLSIGIKRSLYYLPIEVSFVNDEDNEMFNTKILEHVRKDSRNSGLH